MAGLRPTRFHDAVTRGVLGSSMPRFDTVLDEAERWDVALYAWTMSVSPGARATGDEVYEARCAACHGPDGRGVQSAPLDDPRLADRSRIEADAWLASTHPRLWDDLDGPTRGALLERLFGFLLVDPEARTPP